MKGQDIAAPDAEMESASRPDTPRRHRVSVVIPAKNEALNIGWVLSRLPPSVDEVVLVDGLSSVATVTVAQARREVLAAREQNISLTPEEQLAFWTVLNQASRLTDSQRRLGSVMRGES